MRRCKDCGENFEEGKHKRWCCNYCHNIRVKVSKYKIPRKEVLRLWNKSNCDICNEEMNRKNIDHCHSTGKVRGVLCSKCNTALGKFNDDIELLGKAIEYLKTETL